MSEKADWLVSEKANTIIGFLPEEDQEYVHAFIQLERVRAKEWAQNQIMAFNIAGLLAAGLLAGLVILGGQCAVVDNQHEQKYERLQKSCVERVLCPCLEEL